MATVGVRKGDEKTYKGLIVAELGLEAALRGKPRQAAVQEKATELLEQVRVLARTMEVEE